MRCLKHALNTLLLAAVILCVCLNNRVYLSSIGALPSFFGAILASRWVALDIRSLEFNKQPGSPADCLNNPD